MSKGFLLASKVKAFLLGAKLNDDYIPSSIHLLRKSFFISLANFQSVIVIQIFLKNPDAYAEAWYQAWKKLKISDLAISGTVKDATENQLKTVQKITKAISN